MRVAFFTAGTHGAGHSMRGLAIRRALERRGFRGELGLFGPDAAAWSPGFTSVPMLEEELRSAERARASAVAETLRAFSPDVLLVDMFWAPLRHVLPIAGCEAWLLLRAFPETWLVGPPGHPFDVTQYARRIAIEPLAVAPEITDRIDPIVCINREEQRPRGALRERFAVASDKRLVVVVHAGKLGETREMLPVITRDEALVVLDLHAGDALVPAAEWLGDADVVHAAAGYNTFWEASWLGHFARTHFTPFARPNDRQTARLALSPSERTMRENGADALAAMLTR